MILFRGGNYSDSEMCNLLERVLKEVTSEVMERSICVVDRRRIRITQLPLSRKYSAQAPFTPKLSGKFTSEAEFEKEVIVPLLKKNSRGCF